VEAPVRRNDLDIIDARLAADHQPFAVELPILIAVRLPPPPVRVMPFIAKAHGDHGAVESVHILDRAALTLPRPFRAQKRDDRRAALQEP
jgi:hypothetical protein